MHDFLGLAGEGLSIALRHWGPLLVLALVVLGMLGRIGKGAGLFHLFRDDDEIFGGKALGGIESRFAACGRQDDEAPVVLPPGLTGWLHRLLASPAFWSGAGLVGTVGLTWLLAFTVPPDAGRLAAALHLGPPGASATAWWVLAGVLALAAAGAVMVSRRHMLHPRSDFIEWSPRRRWAEPMRAGLGGAVALAVVLLVQAVAAALGAATGSGWAGTGFVLVALPFAAGVVWVFARPNALPCVSIFALAFLAIVLLAGLGRLGGPLAQLVPIGAVLWIRATNGRFGKYRLPGFADALYDNPEAPVGGEERSCADQVDPLGALAAWHKDAKAADPDRDPILVLVATSGGAYRATFWTSLILDRLVAGSRGEDARWPGLDRNVRLVTGASGGMVAGAYFVAMSAEGRLDEGVTCRIIGDTRRSLGGPGRRRQPIGRDSLSPVVHQMLRGDLWHSFRTATPASDRGRMLEAQWPTLDRSFETLRAGETAGRVPSIVFSPMLVESGALALISNLDLGGLRRRSTRIHDAPKAELAASVEVLDQFKDTQRSVTLATAVRLSASFPYVSPAVSLPTSTDRRVVDAGYFDNYGIDIASGFLEDPGVCRWIRQNCAGVAVIELRAFEGQPTIPPAGAFARAFHFLTSPPEALFSARRASQVFRNNQQLRAAVERYGRAEGAAGDFLRVFTFEAACDVSMSWYQRLDELEAMDALLLPPEGEVLARAEAKVRDCRGARGLVEAVQRGDAEARLARHTLQRQVIAQEFAALEAFFKHPNGADPRAGEPLPTWLAAAAKLEEQAATRVV